MGNTELEEIYRKDKKRTNLVQAVTIVFFVAIVFVMGLSYETRLKELETQLEQAQEDIGYTVVALESLTESIETTGEVLQNITSNMQKIKDILEENK